MTIITAERAAELLADYDAKLLEGVRRIKLAAPDAMRTIIALTARVVELEALLERNMDRIVAGRDILEPAPFHTFPGADTLGWYRDRNRHLQVGADRFSRLMGDLRSRLLKTQRKADADADQASIREKKLRDQSIALQKDTDHE